LSRLNFKTREILLNSGKLKAYESALGVRRVNAIMKTQNFRWILFVVILSSLFFYTAHRIHQFLPGQRGIAWSLTALIFALMISWQFVYRSGYFQMDSVFFMTLAWTGSMSLGLWAIFMILSLPLDIASLAMKLYQAVLKSFAASAPVEPERRAFFTQWIPAALGSISAGIGVFGLQEALAGPKVKEVDVPIAGLPPDLDGLKIAQISDLHVGPTIRKNYVEKVVSLTQALKPDLIAVTGDLIDGFVDSLDPHTRSLGGLQAPLGVYYVTGNHEYYWGAQPWIDQCKSWGFLPLLNENRLLKVGGARLLVGGVTDTSAHQFEPTHLSDPAKAAHSSEMVDFKLLLAHRPSSCFDAEKAGFGLQLSGHTHAGQFFPFNLFVPFAHPYYKGLNRHGKMWVYVNSGTGYWGPAIRMGVPSEITLLRLKRLES
jgi:predicted MPP superfamily phosphohydrolase